MLDSDKYRCWDMCTKDLCVALGLTIDENADDGSLPFYVDYAVASAFDNLAMTGIIPKLKRIDRNLYTSPYGDVYAHIWHKHRYTMDCISNIQYKDTVLDGYRIPYVVFPYGSMYASISKFRLILSAWYGYDTTYEAEKIILNWFLDWIAAFDNIEEFSDDEHVLIDELTQSILSSSPRRLNEYTKYHM